MQQAVGRTSTAALCSFVCILAQIGWVILCYVFVERADPAQWLAGVAGISGAVVGICLFAGCGAAFGYAGRHTTGGKVMLAVNAVLFVVTTLIILTFVG